jgi:hypothetical protein
MLSYCNKHCHSSCHRRLTVERTKKFNRVNGMNSQTFYLQKCCSAVGSTGDGGRILTNGGYEKLDTNVPEYISRSTRGAFKSWGLYIGDWDFRKQHTALQCK